MSDSALQKGPLQAASTPPTDLELQKSLRHGETILWTLKPRVRMTLWGARRYLLIILGAAVGAFILGLNLGGDEFKAILSWGLAVAVGVATAYFVYRHLVGIISEFYVVTSERIWCTRAPGARIRWVLEVCEVSITEAVDRGAGVGDVRLQIFRVQRDSDKQVKFKYTAMLFVPSPVEVADRVKSWREERSAVLLEQTNERRNIVNQTEGFSLLIPAVWKVEIALSAQPGRRPDFSTYAESGSWQVLIAWDDSSGVALRIEHTDAPLPSREQIENPLAWLGALSFSSGGEIEQKVDDVSLGAYSGFRIRTADLGVGAERIPPSTNVGQAMGVRWASLVWLVADGDGGHFQIRGEWCHTLPEFEAVVESIARSLEPT